MNLIISKSKNSKSLYIQKSFRKNGKSTSKVVKKLGTMEELLPQHNNSEEEVIAWGKKIAKKMTEEEKRDKDVVLISLSQSKLLEPMKQTSYNGGYLFLQDIFHSLKLDKICRDIQDEYKFEYDVDLKKVCHHSVKKPYANQKENKPLFEHYKAFLRDEMNYLFKHGLLKSIIEKN